MPRSFIIPKTIPIIRFAMSNVTRARSGMNTAVMGAGAILFAGSLAIAAFAYIRSFGQTPGPWRATEGFHAIFINASLFAVFAAHHSIFARARVRQAVASFVGEDLERPVYV